MSEKHVDAPAPIHPDPPRRAEVSIPIKLGYRKIIAAVISGLMTSVLTHHLGIDLAAQPLHAIGLDGVFPGQSWARLIPEGASLAAFYITQELHLVDDEDDSDVTPGDDEVLDPPVPEGEQGV